MKLKEFLAQFDGLDPESVMVFSFYDGDMWAVNRGIRPIEQIKSGESKEDYCQLAEEPLLLEGPIVRLSIDWDKKGDVDFNQPDEDEE